MSGIHVGGYVWIPCEVKPGTFPDEVFLIIKSEFGNWVGFTHVSNLQNQQIEGGNSVKAIILEMIDNRVLSSIKGESLSNTICENLTSEVEPIDTFQT